MHKGNAWHSMSQWARKKITVAAPRNVHKAFINACILLDIDVEWIYPKGEFTSICAGSVTPEDVERCWLKQRWTAFM